MSPVYTPMQRMFLKRLRRLLSIQRRMQKYQHSFGKQLLVELSLRSTIQDCAGSGLAAEAASLLLRQGLAARYLALFTRELPERN